MVYILNCLHKLKKTPAAQTAGCTQSSPVKGLAPKVNTWTSLQVSQAQGRSTSF